MADEHKEERTEPASARKRQDARAKGQVAQSQEVNSSLVLLASIWALGWLGPNVVREVMSLSRLYWSEGLHRAWTAESAPGELAFLLQHLALGLGPMLLLLAVAGVSSQVLQVGVMFSAAPLKPNFAKLNPLEGAKRLFSKNGLVELVKACLKLTIIGWIAYGTLHEEFLKLLPFHGSNLAQILPAVGHAAQHLAFRISLSLFLIALADYGWQRFQFEEGLKMTHEEVKEESKQSEGDPRVRARQRMLARQMARRRMIQEVPTADVVITNPTHYAVALRYKSGESTAPVVVAKGARLIAQRIKELAREHGIPTVEDVALARGLYKSVEVGQEIPAQFFETVAEVLAFVYRLRARRAGMPA